MNDRNLAHPDLDRLTAFAQGRLGEADLAELASHLGDCAACREKVEAAGDDTLISLLRAADTAHDREEAKQAQEAVTRTPPPATPAPPGLPADLAAHGRYRVQELLGVGGMGAVYKAEHLLMERPVALKLISRDLTSNPAMVERFRREVKTAAKLKHPNIVMAYDAEQAGESHFLVMEYVEGTSLARLVTEQGPLPVRQACDYIRQAALGLQHAHERGMVHRDIKPQNLMLTPDGQVKILDFGLARFAMETAPTGALLVAPATEATSGSESLTQVGTVMGTPDYIAPEQAQDAHTADIRADIYSLGCTLYDLLAGHAPFPEGTVVAKVMAHVERMPKPLTELRADVPPALARVVERMMAKDPAKRYQRPAEVAAALAPFTAVAAVRRRRWPVAVAAALLLAVTGYFAPSVYRIVLDEGTLVIETDDEQVEVALKNSKVLVRDRARDREYTVSRGRKHLKSGDNYELQVSDADGLQVFTHQFTITRNGKTAVNVTWDVRNLQAWDEDRRRGAVGFEILAQEGHTAMRLRSLTLIFLGTDDHNVPRAHGFLSVPQPGMTGNQGETKYNDFLIRSQQIVNGVNRISTALGEMTLRDHGLRLAVGGQTFDVYGEPRTIPIPPNRTLEEREPAAQSDYEKVQGTWRGVAAFMMGERAPDEIARQMIVKFSGDTMETPPSPRNKGGKGTFVLDPTKTPKQIHLTADAAENFAKMQGVYSLDGDTLRICMSAPEHGAIREFGGKVGLDITLRRERGPGTEPKAPPIAIAPFSAEQAKAHQDAWAKHLGVPVEIKNSIGMRLRLIPAGKFMMGETPETVDELVRQIRERPAGQVNEQQVRDIRTEAPQHAEEISAPYYMGQHEVTVGQFRKFVEATKYKTTAEAKGGVGWRHAEVALSEDHPVAAVSLRDANEFCAWLSKTDGRTYVVPDEKYWEFACRAGTTSPWYADKWQEVERFAWWAWNAEGTTHAVGGKLPNAFGLFDILGNVEELCRTPGGGVVGRGGMFHLGPFGIRCAARNQFAEDATHGRRGFRVAIVGDLKATEPGWVSLFNGTDLTGWKAYRAVWKIHDGAIVADAAGDLELERQITGNFHLRFQVKLTRGFGLIRFHSPDSERNWTLRLERSGDTQKVCGKLTRDATGLTGEYYGLADLGEWFLLEIVAKDHSVTAFANGKWAMFIQDPQLPPPDGRIRFSILANGNEMAFRDIELKQLPLPKTAAAQPQSSTTTPPGTSQEAARANKLEAAAKVTEAWLKLVDAGDYARSWEQAAPSVRDAVSKQNFVLLYQQAAKKFGKLQARALVSRGFTELSGSPVGEHVVSTYKSGFENWADVTQQVVAVLDKDGVWRVSEHVSFPQAIAPPERDVTLAVRAGRGQLSKEEQQELARRDPSLAAALADPLQKPVVELFANLPDSARQQLLKEGHLRWKFTALDAGRQKFLRDFYQRRLDATKKLGLDVPAAMSLDALEKCDVGFALVNVLGLKHSAISWYVMLPARPLPHVLPVLGGPTAENLPAWHEAHLQQIPPLLLRPYSTGLAEFTGAGAGTPRNPFGLPDVADPFGADVQALAAETKLPGGPYDPNAEQWVAQATKGSKDSLDGEWFCRWREPGTAGWQYTVKGTAQIKTVGERVFFLYADHEGRILLETRRQGNRLVGREWKVDKGEYWPCVFEIVSPERLDGTYGGQSRFDFRRKLEQTDQEKIQGTWKGVSGHLQGQPLDALLREQEKAPPPKKEAASPPPG
jgi:uncharacterized protein (TIGR03067 family)